MPHPLTSDGEALDPKALDSELTRRVWMLRVGEMALGIGFAGMPRARASQPIALPPGLYEPLTDHLGHALESAGRFHPVASGSATDYVKPRTEPFHPLFFSSSDFAVVHRLTALILGEGSDAGNHSQSGPVEEVAEWVDLRVASSAGTRKAALALDPSHRAVMVAYHGAGTVRDLETFDPQNVCRDGLAWLENESRARHRAEFLALSADDQLQLLAVITDERIQKDVENAGIQFFKFLKSEVIRGFYTSQAGLRELDYKGNAFYARSPGCSKLK
jgi:Gluconate 2-dehydrogenase subunit 3